MVKEKDKKKKPVGSVKIEPDTLVRLRAYCKENGLVYSFVCNAVISEFLSTKGH